MKKIETKNPQIGSIIYQGLYEINDNGKNIKLYFQDDNYIDIDINTATIIGNPIIKKFNMQDIMFYVQN